MGSTYLTMKMTVATALFVLIALINGVQMNDPLIEDSSGDGESSPAPRWYKKSFIDRNGEIYQEYPYTFEEEYKEESPEPIDEEESTEPTEATVVTTTQKKTTTKKTTTKKKTTTQSPQTNPPSTKPIEASMEPTEATVLTTTQSPQTNPPTTQSSKPDTTTAMLDVTTVTTTTSTPMPSSEADKVTTVVEMETSTFSPEAVEPEKMDKSTESAPKRSTTEPTVLTPAIDRSVCTFVEEDFTCRDELICYGEGEIDCTDYDDEDIGVEADVVKQVSTYNSKSNLKDGNDGRPLADAAETMDTGNVKPSAKTEDYAEYDADESDTIETFPPSLVGVASHKRIPFILRPSASTEVSPNATDEIPTTATTKMDEVERFSTTITSQLENKDLEKTLTTSSSSAIENNGSDVGLGLVSQLTTAAESVLTTPELSESNSNLTSAETSTADENIVAPNNTNTVSDDEENVEIKTQMNIPTTIELNYRSLGRRSLIRKKRQDNFMESNSSSSQSQTFHVAALESTQRKLRVKVCRLSGDIVCKPVPTLTMCKGKSYCQATSSPADTTESATTRGVETWAIIVIVVCALSGFLTICLLIYLVVTSCKKLKVQPSIEVTTLNYINRGASSNEVA